MEVMKTEYSKKVLTPRPRTSKSDQSSLSFWFLKVLVVLALIGVVIWLSLLPKPPVFVAREIAGQNSSTAFRVTASNPNKRIGIYYGDMNVTVYRGGVGVGRKSVSGFYQGSEGSDSFEVAVGDEAVESRAGEVKLGLRTNVRYKLWRSVGRSGGLTSVEANVSVGLGGEGVELRLVRKLLFHSL